jgi:hyperosmotically inducible protein
MKAFTSFLLGLIIGGVAIYFVMSPRARETVKEEAIDIREKAAQKTPEVKAKLEQAGQAAAKAADDTRITAAIKTKLAVDPELSALQISVNTTEGIVTLAGRVKTPDLGEKAMTVAKSVDGVREVKSTLQPDSERK